MGDSLDLRKVPDFLAGGDPSGSEVCHGVVGKAVSSPPAPTKLKDPAPKPRDQANALRSRRGLYRIMEGESQATA